jgi:AraC family transcriptional regulator
MKALTRTPARHPSFAAFFAEGPYAQHVQRQAALGALDASLSIFDQPRGEFPDPATPDLVLGMPLAPGGRARVNFGAGRFDYTLEPGSLWLQPAFADTECVVDSQHAGVVLALPWSRVLDVLAPEAPRLSDFGRLHGRGFHDGLVSAAMSRMLEETTNPNGSASRLFYESALCALLHALWLRSLDGRRTARPCGGLAPWQIRRVFDHVEERLDADISLKDMAALCGLSTSHFCAAFKTSVGEPPYRFALRRRVERAKLLLSNTKDSMADIALAVGFSSSGHFATVFKQFVGRTPSDWRRH